MPHIHAVHHGRFFNTRGPETPDSSPEFSSVVPRNGVKSVQAQPTTSDVRVGLEPILTPYIAYGFIIQLVTPPSDAVSTMTTNETTSSLEITDAIQGNDIGKEGQEGEDQKTVAPSIIVYISDVSFIPDETWNVLRQCLSPSTSPPTTSKPTSCSPHLTTLNDPDLLRSTTSSPSSGTPNPLNSSFPSTHTSKSDTTTQVAPLGTTLLILLCLHLTPHSSHYGLLQALLTAHRLRPRRTYLVGLAHGLTHAELTLVGERFQLVSSLSALSLSSASPHSLRKPKHDLSDHQQPPSEGEIVRALEK